MMKNEKTLFVVLDIETTEKKRLAFDVAWTITDKQGNDYGSGSYLISEVLKIDKPFYKAKWSQYLLDLEAGNIAYANISEVIETLNQQISKLKAKGHRVILCAYNARFDMTWLPYTYLYITDDRNTDKFNQWTDLLDIWAFWENRSPCLMKPKRQQAENIFRLRLKVHGVMNFSSLTLLRCISAGTTLPSRKISFSVH